MVYVLLICHSLAQLNLCLFKIHHTITTVTLPIFKNTRNQLNLTVWISIEFA